MNIGDGRNLFSWEMVYMPSYRAKVAAAAVVVVFFFFCRVCFAFARFFLCKTITAMLMLTKPDQKCLNMLCFILFGDFCWIRKMRISVVLYWLEFVVFPFFR